MSYSVVTIPPFDRQLKRLAKKHPSIKTDLAELQSSLKQVKQMSEGKMKKQSAKDFLKEL
ncbi:MAG TPA: hypothetical protein VFG54_02920 [Prolixibacteraceae bacterium]|nr:hypothetical protein [Prolixibacteraceae bacterium]